MMQTLDYNLKLAYVPPLEQYNGILILLREPNDPNKKTVNAYLEGNAEWFQDVINGRPSPKYIDNKMRNKSIPRYGNRFREMLLSIEENQHLLLCDVIYGNLSAHGGNNAVGDQYWRIKKISRLNMILSELTIKGYNPKNVFVCQDLFKLIVSQKDTTVYPEKGLQYNKRDKRQNICYRNGIYYFEIIHPARSPRIKAEEKVKI